MKRNSLKSVLMLAFCFALFTNICKAQKLTVGTDTSSITSMFVGIDTMIVDALSLPDSPPCENPSAGCPWQPFIYQTIQLDSSCVYEGTGIFNNTPVEFVITGYYKCCPPPSNECMIEIVDVLPLPKKGNYKVSCNDNIANNKVYFSGLVKVAQRKMLEAFYQKSQEENSGVNFPTKGTGNDIQPAEGNHYQVVSKPCWHKVLTFIGIAVETPEGLGEIKWQSYKSFVGGTDRINTTNKDDDKLQDNLTMYTMKNCLGLVCCSSEPYIKWEGDIIKSIDYNDYGNVTMDDCNMGTIPYNPPCTPICAFIFQDYFNTGLVHGLVDNSSVSPNPNNGTMTFTLQGAYLGLLNMEITDISGNIILQKQFNKSSEQFSIDISIPNISNGNYYYKILQAGSAVSNGAFSIQK